MGKRKRRIYTSKERRDQVALMAAILLAPEDVGYEWALDAAEKLVSMVDDRAEAEEALSDEH